MRRSLANAVFMFLVALAVLSLPRGLYSAANTELLISDMNNYVQIAQNILDRFYFGISEALIAYKPPGSSVIIAGAMAWDETAFEFTYLVIVLLIEAAAVALVCHWLWRSYSVVYAIVFLLIVALMRSSIFWSIKVSTEGLTEALLLLGAGGMLCVVGGSGKTGTILPAIVAGVAVGWGIMVRPPFAVSGFCLAIAIPITAYGLAMLRRITKQEARRIATGCVFFFLSMTLIWSPWIIRNAIGYGHFQPLSNHGVISALWEYAGIPVDRSKREGYMLELPDGTLIEPRINAIRQSRALFEDDFAFAAAYRPIVTQWYIDNASELPGVFERRFLNVVDSAPEDRASGLTTLPRERFDWPAGFQWFDAVLIEWGVVTWGLFGLSILFLIVARPLEAVLLGSMVVVPFAVFIVIYAIPRFIEPYMPLVYLTIVTAVAEAGRRLGVGLHRNRSDGEGVGSVGLRDEGQ